jgi:hypothetical protein
MFSHLPRGRPGVMRKFFRCHLIVLVMSLLIGACGSRGAGGGGTSGGGGTISTVSVTADNAEPLTQASLDLISKIAVIGNIALDMIKLGVQSQPDPSKWTNGATPIDVPCKTPISGTEYNQISYQTLTGSFFEPPGPALHVPLYSCEIENVVINAGTMDIAGVSFDDPTFQNPSWNVSAVIVLSPFEIWNDNGMLYSVTDKIYYTAAMDNGKLMTTLRIQYDPDPGIPAQQAGLNAQYVQNLAPPAKPSSAVNYQLRPFNIVTTDDPNTGNYSVRFVRDPSNRLSSIDRYTCTLGSDGRCTNVQGEIKFDVQTPQDIVWLGGRPAVYSDMPIQGQVQFDQNDGCTSARTCGSIFATVTNQGVALTGTTSNGEPIQQSFSWSTLLSPP